MCITLWTWKLYVHRIAIFMGATARIARDDEDNADDAYRKRLLTGFRPRRRRRRRRKRSTMDDPRFAIRNGAVLPIGARCDDDDVGSMQQRVRCFFCIIQESYCMHFVSLLSRTESWEKWEPMCMDNFAICIIAQKNECNGEKQHDNHAASGFVCWGGIYALCKGQLGWVGCIFVHCNLGRTLRLEHCSTFWS